MVRSLADRTFQLRSRPRDAIRAEVEALVADGYMEVTLLGQNIDSWGSDLSPKQSFADMLRDIGSTPGLHRMRFKDTSE